MTWVGIVVACVACSPASGSAAPSVTPPGPSAAPSATALAECQPLALVLPSGELLDLTGSWQGNDLGPYQLRQFGDCLWWVGQNATFSILFFGRLDADFTITGSWATVAASDHVIGGVRNPADLYIGTGTLSLEIEVGAEGTNADATLRKVAETDSPDFAPGYSLDVTAWVRMDDTPDHPVPSP
ncbi:MAG: hypothetical protein ACRDFR_01865 [Candidatus Limnocylindria bacterium]